MNRGIILLNRLSYVNYKFTSGYTRLLDKGYIFSDNDVDNSISLLANGYTGVFFDKTYKTSNLVNIDYFADCIVGFKVKTGGVTYKLLADDREILSGISGKGDGIFTTGDQPKQDSYDDSEGFRVNEFDNAHAELIDSHIVGRNYLPLIKMKWQIVLDQPSEVSVYYMSVGNDIRKTFTEKDHMIEIFGVQYCVNNSSVYKIVE
jgi:hypothetical protein